MIELFVYDYKPTFAHYCMCHMYDILYASHIVYSKIKYVYLTKDSKVYS